MLEAASGAVEASGLNAASFAGLLDLTTNPLTHSYPGHSGGEYRNSAAFAALRADGSLVTWGSGYYGGDSSAVASQIDGSINVTQVFSSGYAFAALRADGSVVTWPSYGNSSGGDSSAVASQLNGTIDVTQVFSAWNAFAALRADGSLVTWGYSTGGGDSSAVASQIDGTIDVTQVFSNYSSFAALRADGSVVTWGDSTWGGDSSAVASQLNGTIDVTQVFSSLWAFAALRADGSVVTWGYSSYGGDSSAVASQIDGTIDVTRVFSTASAFAALRADGSVVTWGVSTGGGDSSAVASQIDGSIDVTQVFSTESAFAALRADGSVVTWGNSSGGDSSAVASQIDGSIDVTQVFSTQNAFAALRADGSVVTWGNSTGGGDSSAVASQIDGSIDVTQVFSTASAFAALRADGSVVTWGNSSGGDSSAVASQIDGSIHVTQVFSNYSSFAALRADGSVVTWGGSTWGGDSSAVASQIDGSIDVVWMANPFTDDIYTVTDSTPDTTDDYADEAGDATAPIGILTLGSSITGNIGPADSNDTYGDKDVFKILLAQGGTYQINLESEKWTGLSDAIFTIHDPGNFESVLGTSAIGSSVAVQFTADTSGYHYIRVGSGSSVSDQGSYLLSVTEDSRVVVDQAALGTFPYNAVVAVDASHTFDPQKSFSRGTGVLVADNIVLSVGHIAEQEGRIVEAMRVTASMDQPALTTRDLTRYEMDGDPAPNVVMGDIFFPRDYLDNPTGYTDLSLLRVSGALDPLARPMGLIAFVNPADAVGLGATTAGYPGMLPGDTRVLYETTGSIIGVWEDTNGKLLVGSPTLDTSGGHSGGPVWTTDVADGEARVFALLQGGYVAGQHTDFPEGASFFTPITIDTYQAIIERIGNVKRNKRCERLAKQCIDRKRDGRSHHGNVSARIHIWRFRRRHTGRWGRCRHPEWRIG